MRSAKAGGAEGGERGMSRESGWARGGRALPIFIATKQMHFLQTHNQGLRQLFMTLSMDLCAYRGTPDGILVSL